MSVHTRAHPTRGAYKTHSIAIEEKSVSWREAFKEGIEKFTEAGLVLAGCRLKADMTQKELAEKLGIKPHHISEMEHGKRFIGKAMAHRLAKILNMDYRLFL